MNAASALLELQNCDVEIIRAEKRLEELPEKRAILEVRAKQREVATVRQKAELLTRKLEAEIKARQDETTMLGEKIAGEQTKIMGTTDHRQIQALTREMDGLKRRVDKIEIESLQFMERVEQAREKLATIDEALASLGAKEAALIERYKAVGTELQNEIAAMRAKRAELGTSVPADLLKRYDDVRESKGGVGVGRLDGDSCTACRMSLPAERVRDLLAGPDIGVCPTCRRLIVVREEAAE